MASVSQYRLSIRFNCHGFCLKFMTLQTVSQMTGVCVYSKPLSFREVFSIAFSFCRLFLAFSCCALNRSSAALPAAAFVVSGSEPSPPPRTRPLLVVGRVVFLEVSFNRVTFSVSCLEKQDPMLGFSCLWYREVTRQTAGNVEVHPPGAVLAITT